LDAHPSRRNPELWRECAAQTIDVLTIPAHTSHLLQPLDRGINAAFKRKLSEEYEVPDKPGVKAHRKALAFALLPAVQHALQQNTIRAAWRACGIEPFDPLTPFAHLPASSSADAAPAAITCFSISAELLTEAAFLDRWDLYLGKTTKKKKKAKEKEEKPKPKKKPKKQPTDSSNSDAVPRSVLLRHVRRLCAPPKQAPPGNEKDVELQPLPPMKKEKIIRPSLTIAEIMQMGREDDECRMKQTDESDSDSDWTDPLVETKRNQRVIYDDAKQRIRYTYRLGAQRLHLEPSAEPETSGDAGLRRSQRQSSRIPLLSGKTEVEDEEEEMELESYLRFFNR
jgi:hypothetical protein